MYTQNLPEPDEVLHTASGYKICHYKTVSSTNHLAKEIAKKSNEEKTVILAENQTSGKGRLGRHWVSPKGGIWLSIILRPKISPREALKLTFIASSAVAKTIQNTFGLEAQVKWPNDVFVNRKKISGILTEATTQESLVEFVVLGVGINANVNLNSFPNDLRRTVTSLKHELGREVKKRPLIKTLLQNFEHNYKRLQRGMWHTLLQEWKSMAMFLGEQVEIASFGENFAGKALDVDQDGALIIRLDNGELRRVITGDVTVKKQR
ncbi:MAG: biotin--[acetyl-CoA-carboxylase] ligase [Candidatus Bathyarchaeia archaeon]